MIRAALLAGVAATLGACLAAQSARVLSPGSTSVSVAAATVGSATIPGDDEPRTRWFGQLAIRHGVTHRLEAGVVAARTLGSRGAVYALAVEPRIQVVPPRGRLAVALGLSVGLAGSEYVLMTDIEDRRETRFEGYLLATSATIGVDLRRGVELVLVPRAFLLVPARDSASDRPGLGAVAGLRFSNGIRTWAVQPELGVHHLDGDTLLTVGLSIGGRD